MEATHSKERRQRVAASLLRLGRSCSVRLALMTISAVLGLTALPAALLAQNALRRRFVSPP